MADFEKKTKRTKGKKMAISNCAKILLNAGSYMAPGLEKLTVSEKLKIWSHKRSEKLTPSVEKLELCAKIWPLHPYSSGENCNKNIFKTFWIHMKFADMTDNVFL